jgi:hypothetical protein
MEAPTSAVSLIKNVHIFTLFSGGKDQAIASFYTG